MAKTVQEIIDRCKVIDAEQAALEALAEKDGGGKFTDEQRTAYTALKTEYDALMVEKKAIEDDMELRSFRANRDADLTPRVISRRAPANSGAPVLVPVPAGGAAATPIEREQTLDANGEVVIPRFSIPRTVIRHRPSNFRGTIDGYTAEERAYRFGMWCLARLSRDLPNKFNFPTAVQFVKDHIQPLNVAHGETGGATGGEFLVPEEFSSDIIVLREMYGVARRLFKRSVMTSDVKHEPKRLTGLTAFFVAEGSAGTESNMSWQDILLVAKDVMCLSRFSNQLSMDAVIDIGDTLAGEIAYAFAAKEDACAFIGNGTSTYGGINGVLNLLTDCDGAGTDSIGLKVGTGSGWAGLTLADFEACAGLLPAYADTPNVSWVTHKGFYYGTMLRLALAAGGNAQNDIAEGGRSQPRFLGYPVEFSQIMPNATAAGVMAALGDFRLGALFGDRQQTSIAFSESAVIGGQSVFENNQIAVRGTERFDINVHGCGTATVLGPIVGISCG